MPKNTPNPAADPIMTFLDSLSKPLVAELTKLIKASQPENTALLDFELHLSNELDVIAFPMDSGAGQLGNTFLLKKTNRHVPKNLTDEQLDSIFSAFIPWFSNCWDQSGGKRFSLPAYVSQHDSNKSFDLKQNKWVKSSEKWSE